MQALMGVRSVRMAVMLPERSVEGTLSTPVQLVAERELKQSWMGSKVETKVLQVSSSHLPDSKTGLSRTWTWPSTCQDGGESCWTWEGVCACLGCRVRHAGEEAGDLAGQTGGVPVHS